MESSDGISISTVTSKQSTPKHNKTQVFILNDGLRSLREKNLKKVRTILLGVGEGSPDGLKMIDTVQRLGIDYNFQEEIEAILKTHYMIPYSHQDNLQDLALRFRLLRQEGFHVNPVQITFQATFFNFKKNKDQLVLENDIKSLMELYEASQLSMEGEDIVDEVGELSAKILHSCLPCLDKDKSKIVADTLNYPAHKYLARLTVGNFRQNLEVSDDRSLNHFLELAKIEHCMTRMIHQNEILLITKWWKELGLAKELKYARNQPIKWHMWSMAVLTDPSLSEQRLELTKPISLVYIIDDVFDVYGTIDELSLFTEAVNRWDFSAAETLPLYMKKTLKALYETTEDISDKIHVKHGWNPFESLQKSWTCLCNAFLVEAEWFASGKMLSSEDYLKNGIITSGVHVVLVHMFFLLGQDLNEHTVDSVDNFPGIISSAAKILRLSDDLGTAQDENQDGQDGSYLIYYMKENPDVTIEDAKEEVRRMVSEAWKKLNQECFSNGPFSATFRKACLNVARMVPLMYNYNDNENIPDLEELMNCFLCET